MFYKINSAAVTLREYRFGTPLLLMPLVGLFKLLRVPISSSADDPAVESLQPFEVCFEAFPDNVRTQFLPQMQALESLGFHSPIFHLIVDHHHSTRIYLATFCHTSGSTFGQVFHRDWQAPKQPRRYLFPVFVTGFDDQTFLVSTAAKLDFLAPDAVRTNRIVGAAPSQLWASHQERLAVEMATRTPCRVTERAELTDLMEKLHVVIRDFHVQRGVFVPLTADEHQSLEAASASVATPGAPPLPYEDVLIELNKLPEKKAGWGNAIVILVVSLILFLGVGAMAWSWPMLIALMVILFIHETGHYVAMKIFKYQNLKMFFIPLFGAAVSGRNYTAPAWKKVIVSLMGPLPGIVLGLGLGIVGLGLHQEWLTKAALLMLFINGFNLLPVLPFDGGWVMHAIVFSRHAMLDVGFRVVAALALMGLGVLFRSNVIGIIAIPMLLSIHHAFLMARVAARLKALNLPLTASDANLVMPVPTAVAIVTEVKNVFPKTTSNKSVAQFTLQVFETLNAAPPRWLASIVLLALYCMGIMLALTAGIAITVIQHRDTIREAFVAGLEQPKYQWAGGALPAWYGQGYDDKGVVPQNTLLATFGKRPPAEALFQRLTNELPATAGARLLGSTVLVSLPTDDDAAHKKWLLVMKALTTNTLVETTNTKVALSLYCRTTNHVVANKVYRLADDYLEMVHSAYLIPPWHPADPRSGVERQKHALGRQTYRKLQQLNSARYTNQMVLAMFEKISQAEKDSAEDEAKNLQKAVDAQLEKLEQQNLQTVRREGTNPVVTRVIDLYASLAGIPETNEIEQVRNQARVFAALGAEMGQLPMKDGQPMPGAERYSSRAGTVTDLNGLLRFRRVQFENAFDGPAALLEWLDSQGLGKFKYEFKAGASGILEGLE